MKMSELRDKTPEELKQELFKARHEQFGLRMKKGTGQLKANHQFKLVKRLIARIHTLLREREANKA